jgi:Spy/CpxP family protein refolding chaperone
MVLRVLPVFAFACLLAAQPGPPRRRAMGGGGGEADTLKTTLNLTDDQVTKLRDLRRAEFDAVKPILDKLRDNRDALKTATDKGTDPAAIGNLVLAGKALRQQIDTTNDSYHKQALAVLNPTQQTELKKIQDAAALAPAIGQARALNLLERSDDEVGPGGFGMPMGPGGPGGGLESFGAGRRWRQ